MCFLLVEKEFDFKTSKVGGSVAILRLAMMRRGGGGGGLLERYGGAGNEDTADVVY